MIGTMRDWILRSSGAMYLEAKSRGMTPRFILGEVTDHHIVGEAEGVELS